MTSLWTRLLPSSFSWAGGLATVVRALDGVRATEHGEVLTGRGGSDLLSGTGSGDFIWGGRGDDVLWGGAGHDIVSGGRGADVLAGGAGADWLQGGAGPDYLSGADLTDPFGELDTAANTLDGGSGNDRLAGGGGDDTLIGGRGSDLLAGNAGDDVFVFDCRSFGHDRVVDFTSGEDQIDLRGLQLEFDRIDTNGDGAIGAGDRGVSLEGQDLLLALRGGVIELAGVTALAANDLLI